MDNSKITFNNVELVYHPPLSTDHVNEIYLVDKAKAAIAVAASNGTLTIEPYSPKTHAHPSGGPGRAEW